MVTSTDMFNGSAYPKSFSIIELMRRVTVFLITGDYEKDLQASESAGIGRRQVAAIVTASSQVKDKSRLNSNKS